MDASRGLASTPSRGRRLDCARSAAAELGRATFAFARDFAAELGVREPGSVVGCPPPQHAHPVADARSTSIARGARGRGVQNKRSCPMTRVMRERCGKLSTTSTGAAGGVPWSRKSSSSAFATALPEKWLFITTAV